MKVAYSLVVFLLIEGLSAEQSGQEKFKEYCKNNGGSEALGDFQKAETDLQRCFGSILKESSWEIILTESAAWRLCTKIYNVKECLKPYHDSFKSCFKKEQLEYAKVLVRVSMAGLQFVCDNSEDIQEALRSKDLNCLTTKTNTLKGCLDQITNSFEAISSQQGANGIFGKDTKVCSVVLESEQRSVEALNECEDKRFTTLLDSMYKYINNEIPCDNLPKSKASTTGVLSFLILIIPMVFINL